MMVRRDPAGVRLLTRNGHDWTGRFPLIAEAAGALRARSFLIDGEAVACDGLPVFDRLRYRRQDGRVFLFAFDLRGPTAQAAKGSQARLGCGAADQGGGWHSIQQPANIAMSAFGGTRNACAERGVRSLTPGNLREHS
jgi:hypothetical protein